MDKQTYINKKVREMKIIERQTGSKYSGRLTENGIRKSFYGKTKSEVRNKAKEWLMNISENLIEDSSVTLGEYIEYWLMKYKKDKIEPSSYDRLESVYVHQVKHQLGHIKLQDLKSDDIQNLINDYANPPSDGLALALSGLKRLKELLNACLNIAVEEGLLQKNPCRMVILPNKNCVLTPTKRQISLSDEQILMIKDRALSKFSTRDEFHSRDWIVLLIILSLGLRVGEALALNWSDFDFTRKIVSIRKTIQSSKELGTIVKDGAKTMAGSRVLALNENVIYYLNEIKAYDIRNGINSPIFCCTSVGTRQNARNLQRSLERLLKKTDIHEHVTLHTLRHTFGSCLIRQGVPIEVVSKLMGHASITVTYNKYIHVLQEQEAMAMKITVVV